MTATQPAPLGQATGTCLALENVSISYGSSEAVRGVYMEIPHGKVTAFIPDPDPNPDGGATSGAEGLWVDKAGVIYGAQVKERTVARHIRAK